MRLLWIAVLWLLTLAPPAYAEVSIIGLAGNTCGDWSATSYNSVEYQDWLWGYISGAVSYGRYPPHVLKTTSPIALIVWLKSYCQAHPLDNLAVGADALLKELSKRPAPSN